MLCWGWGIIGIDYNSDGKSSHSFNFYVRLRIYNGKSQKLPIGCHHNMIESKGRNTKGNNID